MNSLSVVLALVILIGIPQAPPQKGGVRATPESPSKGTPSRANVDPRSRSSISTEEIRAAISKDSEGVRLFQAVEQAESRYAQGAAEATRTELLKAQLDFAEYVMLKPLFETSIPETQKYLIAYKSYMRVLELDPKEKTSRGRIQTIVNIYQSWGKTLP